MIMKMAYNGHSLWLDEGKRGGGGGKKNLKHVNFIQILDFFKSLHIIGVLEFLMLSS